MRAASALLTWLALAPAAAAAPSDDLRAGLERAGFGEVAGRAVAAARPTLRVERTPLRAQPRAPGRSHLGGLPDLPASEPWPQCGGQAQSFLGQFRLRDLPAEGRALRRHGGLLLLFAHVEFEEGETEFGLDAGRCATVLHARARVPLARRARPRGATTLRVRPARVRFVPTLDIPDVSLDHNRLAPPLQDIVLPQQRAFAWADARLALQGRGRDPDHRLLGYVDSPNGESGRCWWNTRRRRNAWHHLFSMGYDERLRFEFADAGALHLVIAPGDLRAGRFSRVCAISESA